MFAVHTVNEYNATTFSDAYNSLEGAVLAMSAYAWEHEAPELLGTMFYVRKVTKQSTRFVVATAHYVPDPHGAGRPWLVWNLPHGVRRMFRAKDANHRPYEVEEVK